MSTYAQAHGPLKAKFSVSLRIHGQLVALKVLFPGHESPCPAQMLCSPIKK